MLTVHLPWLWWCTATGPMKALVELDAFVTKLGFKVIAGATFVGEHSYSSEKYPVAAGRPDADDLEYAKLFGEKYVLKLRRPKIWRNCMGWM